MSMHSPDPELPSQPTSQPELLGEGRFLRLIRRNGWEYVQRSQAQPAVAIVALTADGCLLLVEQFRPPLGVSVLELPAGLVGDEVGSENEPAIAAAQRELLEETGYQADQWQESVEVVSSAGLTDERVQLFLAWGLRQTGRGGGVAGEKITVHKTPLSEVDALIAQKAREGVMVDGRVLAGVYLAQRHLNQAGV